MTSQSTDAGAFGVVLTVADHDQNGFVAIAKWPSLAEGDARSFIEAIDQSITTDAEPDIKTAPFTFILDLVDGHDTIDNGKRLLPTQTAMSLAPEQVQRWLNERPDPDSVCMQPIPHGPVAALTPSRQVQG